MMEIRSGNDECSRTRKLRDIPQGQTFKIELSMNSSYAGQLLIRLWTDKDQHGNCIRVANLKTGATYLIEDLKEVIPIKAFITRED